MQIIEEKLLAMYTQIQVPILCKNGSYVDTLTGRKIVKDKAINGEIEYPPGGVKYANQKLDTPIYVDYAWCDYWRIHYRCMRATTINKHGLNWELLLAVDLEPYSRKLGGEKLENIDYWLNEAQDHLFSKWDFEFILDNRKKRYPDMSYKDIMEDMMQDFWGSIGLYNSSIDESYWGGPKRPCVFLHSQRVGLRGWISGNIKKIYERKLDFNGMKHRKFGFELEFTGISRDQAARTVAKVLRTEKLYAGGVYHTHVIRDSAHRIWRIVRDASIYPTVTARHSDPNYDHYKCELVSPILQYKELYLVSKIVCALKAKGASVNDSCGMHVHVDVGDYNAIQLRNLVNIVFGKEELLFKAFNVYGRRREWCTRLDREFLHMINEECGSKLTIKKIEDIWYRDMAERTSHYNLTRYYILNLHSYFQKKGVEFRLYNSTLETDEVKANIIFSIAMCSYAASHKKTASHIKEKPFWMIRARHLGNRDEMSSWLYQIGLRGDEFKFVRAYVKRYLTNEERSAA